METNQSTEPAVQLGQEQAAETVIETVIKTVIAEEQPADTGAPKQTDEEFLKTFNERFGKDYKSLEDIKPPATELTEEEKQRQVTAKEKRMIEKFTSDGKYTIDQFVSLKKIANADIKEFSLMDTKESLIAQGISKDDVDDVIKERYYLLTDEEKAELGEEDKALLKKNEIFSKQLETKAKYKIEQAQSVFAQLAADIEAEDLLIQTDAKISSTVDEYAAKMDRAITIDLGMSNDLKLNPVQFKVEDADMAEAMTMLKDPVQRNNFLYNKDGSENVENLIELFKWKAIAPSLVKKAALQGATEQVEFFQTHFPNSPYTVAPGTAAKTNKGGTIGKAIEGTEKIVHRTTG